VTHNLPIGLGSSGSVAYVTNPPTLCCSREGPAQRPIVSIHVLSTIRKLPGSDKKVLQNDTKQWEQWGWDSGERHAVVAPHAVMSHCTVDLSNSGQCSRCSLIVTSSSAYTTTFAIKFCEDLIAYIRFTRHGPHRKRHLQQFFIAAVMSLQPVTKQR
jgi:hypothetical protein